MLNTKGKNFKVHELRLNSNQNRYQSIMKWKYKHLNALDAKLSYYSTMLDNHQLMNSILTNK